MSEQAPKNPYQSTLNLNKTTFSIRANAQTKEPELLQRWEADDLDQKVTDKNKGEKKFILHDGPPYANGHLHIGHALTYILKDIVCKIKRMEGYHAPLVPGWDCHGLPIELKVTAELSAEQKQHSVDRATFKKYCRAYAQQWIAIQKAELKDFGKLADYQHAYLTMSPGYEASTIRALATFIEKGFIERKLKTVPWCSSCQTVLATAEIEYKDRTDPSIYVLFPFNDAASRLTFPFLYEKYPQLSISFAVWTTTPWTLPLNRAVVLNPSAVYVVLQGKEPNQAIIVAKELADTICAEIGIDKIELAEADAIVFDGKKAEHPFVDGLQVPLILDDMVDASSGTACLHSAPGCGPEDYVFGVKHGLEIYSPLSADGKYIKGIQPAALEGMSIRDGQTWVLEALADKERLLHRSQIDHSYPHCWRCHKGLMFRATNQWFCDLQKNDLVKRTLDEINTIGFVPERGQARLRSFIANRSEWCISRQRQWGVPIPAIMCDACGTSTLQADFVNAVADRVAIEGIEFWDRMDVKALVKEGLLPDTFCCSGCRNNDHTTFTLERDILDVWFDSGASSYAVLAQDPDNLGVPADVYFEGSDQHRGWFQSSLLCGMVLYDHAPMKTIVTHGFIIDDQKRKMSKSVGNVVAPQDVITKYSRDVLRLWVASSDFSGDLMISDNLLQSVAEMYRKIRNTCRFLIANLYDFDITKDAVEVDAMLALDQYMLATLYQLNTTVRTAYDSYNFAAGVHAINNYCTNQLSALYLDILKDRLYVEKPDSQMRRSAQTVLYNTLDVITKLLAPVLSFLAEELSDAYQTGKTESIHLQDFSQVVDVWATLSQEVLPEHLKLYLQTQDMTSVSYAMHKQAAWNALEMLRMAVLKAIEVEREKGVVKHPYEASVQLYLDPSADETVNLKHFMQELACSESVDRFFKDWLIVSRVTFVDNETGLSKELLPWASLRIDRADGVKCPRCWQWEVTDHENGLCDRCYKVLQLG